MALEIVRVLGWAFLIATAVLIYLNMNRLIKAFLDWSPSDKFEKQLNKTLKQRGKLDSTRLEMSKKGILYRLGDYNASPAKWTTLRVGVAIISALVGYVLLNKPIALPIFGLVGFWGINFLYDRQNDHDNDAMLVDIYNTYSTIKIQITAGRFIADAIEQSYKLASNKRYKEALGEYVLNLADKTISMKESTDIFKSRFDNPNIDRLCAMILNFEVYGAKAEYISDIMTQINSIMTAAAMKAEHNIEQKAEMTSFAFFAVIIFLVVYMVGSTMSGLNIF